MAWVRDPAFTDAGFHRLLVSCPEITLTPSILPHGTKGLAYGVNVSASGGTPPYSFDLVAGALPPGLSLSSVGAVSGTPGATGQYTFTVRATDAGSCSQSQTYTVNVVGFAVFVANFTSNNVSAYGLNPATGELTPVGAPVAAGSRPRAVAVEPTGRFAYVVNEVSATVSAYSIDAASGALSPVGSFAAGRQPVSITADPTGRFLYVADAHVLSDAVLAYRIDGSTGALSAVSGSPFSAGRTPLSVVAEPSGQFLYVASDGGGSGSSTYRIGSGGALTPVAGATPLPFRWLAVEPTGRFLYANSMTQVYAYTINRATGGLAAVSGSPYTTTSTNLETMTADAAGRFVYAVDGVNRKIWAYAVDDAGGALAPVAGSPFAAGVETYRLLAESSGRFLYGINFRTNDVLGYTIAPVTGALTKTTATAAGPGLGPYGAAATHLPTPAPGGYCLAPSLPPNNSASDLDACADTGARVAWNADVGDWRDAGVTAARSYDVLRDGVVVAADLPYGTTSYTDNTGVNGTAYVYSVRYKNGCGLSIATRGDVATDAFAVITQTPQNLSAGVLNNPYSQAVSAAGGSAPYSFAVTAGTLPPGLALASDGQIQGTPTAAGTYSFTLSATDADGCAGTQAHAIIIETCGALTVAPASLVSATKKFHYSQALSAGGGTVPYSFALTGGALPPGLTLDLAGLISGTPTAHGRFTFTVGATDSNNCAGSQTYTLNVGAVLFAYVANVYAPWVSAYRVGGTTGALSPVSSYEGWNGGAAVVADPSGRFVYVAFAQSNSVRGYSINATTPDIFGALTPVPGLSFRVGANPRSAAIDPAGRFLYVGNWDDGNIHAFRIESNGNLTAVAGSPFAQGLFTSSLAVHPSGRFLYSSAWGNSAVYAHQVGTDGALTSLPGSPFRLDSSFRPRSVALDPSGSFLYAAEDGTNALRVFRIQADGSLTALPSFTRATGATPFHVAVDPTGRFVYVANYNGNSVSAYRLEPDGSPTPLAAAPAGQMPSSVAVDPSGTYLYVTNSGTGSTISGYQINADGTLTQTLDSPFAPHPYGSWLHPANQIVQNGPLSMALIQQRNGTAPTPCLIISGLDNNLAADVSACDASGVRVTWSEPRDWGDDGRLVGTRSYDVLRDGVVIKTGLPYGTASYVDTTAAPGVAYRYSVRVQSRCDSDYWSTARARGYHGATAADSAAPVTISPSALRDGAQGFAYSETLTASGGAAPYTFTAGALPDSLALAQSGPATAALSGTPATQGTHAFNVTATDANGCSVEQAFTVTVGPGNTPPGDAVAVAIADQNGGPSPVTSTFFHVDAGGWTRLQTAASCPAAPDGFNLVSSCYDLSTTAAYSCPPGGSATPCIEVCFDYSGMAYGDPSALRVYHAEGGAWVDRTILPVDTANHKVCAAVTSLSPFAVFEEAPPAVTLSAGDASAPEGDAGTTGASFTVTLSAASTRPVSVGYVTSALTAAAGSDYTHASGTLSFAPGEMTKTVVVSVVGDTTDEPDETFVLELTGSANATLGDAQGVGTITDDDPAPSLAVTGVMIDEGNSGASVATLTVTLSAASGRPVSVGYATTDVTATAGRDYTQAAGTLSFAPGETAQTFGIGVLGDAEFEGDETARVTLSDPTNATLGAQGSALLTIADDDPVPTTLVVTTTDDVDDGLCSAPHCSLREAINAANLSSDTSTINFDIAGGGVKTISPTSALPLITQPTNINGYSQPLAAPNTLAVGNDANLLIELDGTNAGADAIGLEFGPSADNSSVRGLVINRFAWDGIRLTLSDNCTVAGNFVGTNAGGTAAAGNGLFGVFLNGSNNTTVGGTTAADRNLISGGTTIASQGVQIMGTPISGNVVKGNYIGTNAAGTAALANGGDGIRIVSSTNTTIGGTTALEANVIAGSGLVGIRVNGDSTIIKGNFIGTNSAGAVLGNGQHGILIASINNVVGGTAGGEANVIANSGGGFDGVFVHADYIGNSIRANSIHGNGGLGIDLFPDGVTPNDSCDADSGPDLLQNFPVITSAVTSGGTTTIQGTLNSAAGTTYTLDFYSNAACDSSGHGEGQTYLGSAAVTTDGDCGATFTFTPSSPVAAGQFITATATDPASNTSEFSACRQNVSPPSNSRPVWATASVNVDEPAGTESDPVQRTADLTLDDADDGQTLSFAVVGAGDCGAGGTHPVTGLGFDPASVVSGSGDETASLVLNVGAAAAAGSPYCVRVSVSDGASTVEQDLTVNVTAQNSSPILDAGQFPQLSSLYFNNMNSPGNLVSELVVDGSVTDPDGAAAEAIAVTAVDNTNGKWQFSSGGVIWKDFWGTTGSPVDLGAADRLLSDAYYIRFVPDTNFSGTATITFRAWDQTSGTAGGTMETNGDAAFSAASDTASVTVEPALSLTVDSTGEEDDASPGDRVCATAANKCTLRAALQEANAVPSADAVGFDIPTSDPGYDSNTGRYTVTLLTTNLTVGGNLAVNGPGPGVLTVRRGSAAGDAPVFALTAGWIVSISGMTITNGNNLGGQGGGIYNGGSTLAVSNCVVTGNHADAGGTGGGIMNHASNSNDATLTVIDSTVSGNSAGGYGGGIGNLADDGRTASLTVIRSTISGNNSSSGGGISSLVNDGVASLTLSNSTVSGNTSNGSGGGVAAVGSSITFTSVTLTNNRADTDDDDSGSGGGLHIQAGSATLSNTIIAGNFNGPSPGTIADDISGAVGASSSFNLIGTGGAGGLADGVNGNHVGVADARLGPLTGNGGVAHTQALLPGSPALEAGDNAIAAAAGLTTDQRGLTYARRVDSDDADPTATVDIGAFEAQVSVENIADKATDESTQLQFDFNVSDGVSSSNVTATSSDTSLMPNANIQVTGAGSPLTLTIDPAAGKIGTTTITVTVTSGGESMTDTFLLTVNLVNDAPSFTKGADQTVNEDVGPHTVSDWATGISAGPPEESGQILSFLVSNDRNALFSAQPEVSPTGTLTYTPATNAYGSATVTVRLKDDGGGSDTSAPQTFTITVNAVADTPSVTAATTAENAKTTSGLVISRNPADGAEVTHFKITDITNGTLYLTGGSTVIADGQFITSAQGNAGLKFLPSQGLSSPSSRFGFKVQASIGNTDAGLSGPPTAATITVKEGGTLRFGAATYNVNEGTASAMAVITVLRAGGSGGMTSVKHSTSGGTAAGYSGCSANRDYVTTAGTLSWADGDRASKTFAIPICNDTIYEGSETINLTLSNVMGSGGLGAPSAAALTIVDNETQPKLSINGVTLAEGNTGARNAAFTVMLSGASSKTVTVNYQTANGSAVAPADYTAVPPTTLTFSPGQTSKTVLVPVNGDLIDELDETFKVVLSSPTNAGLAVSQGTCVITDNDTAAITINNASVTEPDGGTTDMTFTIKLSVPSSRTVSVRYQTANNTATAPADYTVLALTTLTFSPGQTSKTVFVRVRGDLVKEVNETLFVNLSGVVNAAISDAQGLGTILNDD